MDTQREALAKRGVDHDKYEVLLEHNRTIDDETTGIKVVRKSDGKSVEAVMSKSRRQLAEDNDTTYIDTIVDLVHELEDGEMVDPHDEDRRNVQYGDLAEIAKKLLVYSGYVTMNERARMGESEKTSVNETLGMAVRALTEEADKIQRFADSEEAKNL